MKPLIHILFDKFVRQPFEAWKAEQVRIAELKSFMTPDELAAYNNNQMAFSRVPPSQGPDLAEIARRRDAYRAAGYEITT